MVMSVKLRAFWDMMPCTLFWQQCSAGNLKMGKEGSPAKLVPINLYNMTPRRLYLYTLVAKRCH